jgi:hypothetical protein
MTTKQAAISHTLSITARSAIVSTFVQALSANENGGSLVTQVCDVANKHTKGQPLSKPDQDSIIESIASQRSWGENVIKQRSNEVRTILKSCAALPETVRMYTKKSGSCNWHTAMKLARRINAGDTSVKAIQYVLDNKSDSKSAHPAGRVAAGLKAWYAASKSDKRAVIVKAVSMLSTIGLKLELE